MAVVSAATRNSFTPLKAAASGAVIPVITPTAARTAALALQSRPAANPAFDGSVAGKQPGPSVGGATGTNQMITRGYIRRTDNQDKTDPTAAYRLNFMYNPETVQRQFISYLDQNALDPFNTVHGSGNIVAPPGILDFSFELMFDRQLEVFRNDNHPGTKVDYDYFDLVVRGVVPTPGTTVPDNGVMMVNPRNITVVFGPELTVTGKPYNASVSYDKFSHKMTPTRIRILLQMKVLSIGPRPLAWTYQTAQDQAVVAATVPYDNQVSVSDTTSGTAHDLISQTFDGLGLDLGGWSGDPTSDSGTGGTPGGGGVTNTTGGGGAAWNGAVDVDRILKRIREKESSNNYTARSKYSSASGAYQFIDRTWANYGGYARAYQAPPNVQDERARKDVNYFLGKYNNILESVPASWYVGSYKGHGNLNYRPPGAGNPQTVQQYVDDWLKGY